MSYGFDATKNMIDVMSQEQFRTALAQKASLDNPTITGTPKAPTQDTADASTKMATTKFVYNVMDAIYPVGITIFLDSTSPSPNIGTWEEVPGSHGFPWFIAYSETEERQLKILRRTA